MMTVGPLDVRLDPARTANASNAPSVMHSPALEAEEDEEEEELLDELGELLEVDAGVPVGVDWSSRAAAAKGAPPWASAALPLSPRTSTTHAGE